MRWHRKTETVTGEIAEYSCGDPEPVRPEVYTYSMDEFKRRLGLENSPHHVFNVHITWQGIIEVEMSRK